MRSNKIDYRNKIDDPYEGVFELTNITVTEGDQIAYSSKTIVYPFNLQSLEKMKTLIALKLPEREMWINALNTALGYVNIENLYNIQVITQKLSFNRKKLEKEDLLRYGLRKTKKLRNWKL